MDLSNSQSSPTAGNNDFIDFMNRPQEKKDDIVPSYDFMPIRPAGGSSSSPPPAIRSSEFSSIDDDTTLRAWNSHDSKANSSPIRNYSSLDADEPTKFVLGKNYKSVNASLDVSLISEIDRTMKKYSDDLMHSMDGISARLSQLETRTRNLENSLDDLKVSVGNNHGSTDGKMRQLENILREVESGVQFIKDQEIFKAQLQISKPPVPKPEQVENQTTAKTDSSQQVISTHQQFVSLTQAPPTLPPPNAPPPPPPPQQNFQPQVQLPNQYPQNQVPSVPQRDSYYPPPPPGQTPDNPSQQYQMAPPQQHPPPPPPQNQYQSPPQPQYSHPVPPPPPQPQPPSFPPVNPSIPQLPLGHHPEETPYAPPQTYPSGIRPPPSHPSTGVPPLSSQPFYGPNPNLYEPPSSRPGTGYPSSFGPSGHGEPYPYSGSPRKAPQLSASTMSQTGGSGYPQLPTARILPQALPTASGVSGGSGSGGSGNRVPIDDVVDKVTNMGFPRDQVRATVRKLTENGQSVDLNIVLDKLMNDGDGQGPRGWFR